jgi:hypothetical protein
MKLLRAMWRDEAGAVLSAEMVMVGTLGVIGTSVGVAAVSKSVNDELTELAFAFRSLDQSYCVEGQEGCCSWTAGSCYRQRPVEESLADLQGFIDRHEGSDDGDDETIKKKSDRKPDDEESDLKQPDDRKPEKKKSDRDRDDDGEVVILPDAA